MQFKIETFQNPYLACDSNRVDAIISVASHRSAKRISRRTLVEGIIVDTSGSMYGERIQAVQGALQKVITALDPESYFFILGFGGTVRKFMPLSKATQSMKLLAINSTRNIEVRGDTVMSSAFAKAREQFEEMPDCIHHAMFLTDGQNNLNDESQLDAELIKCDGIFQCDCRGVGTDWQPKQLQKIARRLLGTATIIPHATGIAADFYETVRNAMEREVSNVRLRLWMPKTSRLISVKQMSPEILSLTERGKPVDTQTSDFPTGAWGNESRDYHLAISVPPGESGDEMLAGKVSLVYEEGTVEVVSPPGRIIAAWTEDESLSARINAQVAHFTGQSELAEAIQKGLEMREKGYFDVATKLLGKAAKIAADSGNEETTRRLAKVVDIIDAHEGTVRLKKFVAKADEMDLDLGSTRTARKNRASATEIE
ncbi:VWA domain-containing protein [soil metagenome]